MFLPRFQYAFIFKVATGTRSVLFRLARRWHPKSPYGSTVLRLFHFCENLFRKKHRDLRTANQYGFPIVDISGTFEDARLLLSI